MRGRAIATALKAAGRPVTKAARAKCPVDPLADPAGTLKRSLGAELRGRPGRQYLAAGARRGFARDVTRPIIIGGELVGAVTRKADPANYAHLVELGTSQSAATPFLRPAFDGAKGEVKSAFIQSLSDSQDKAARRAANKAGRARAGALL